MVNEPIDRSVQPGASNNISAVAPDTTNSTPLEESGSSLSPIVEEGESMSRVLRGTRATLSPPLGQFFINMILQLAAFSAAIAFGVFAVKSIDIARTANGYAKTANSYAAQALEEARVANQVALLAVCSQSGDVQNSSFAAFCFRVLNGAPIVMPDVASNLFTSISTATTSLATISSSISITQKRPINTTEATATIVYSTLASTSRRTLDIAQPTQTLNASQGQGESSTGLNQKKTIAIALSLSLFFFITIIAIIIYIVFKKRPRGVVSSASVANGNGELHSTQGYIENLGENQRHGNAQGYVVAEHGGVQGHGYPPANQSSKQWQRWSLAGGWWKTFRAYFLDSTVSTE